MILDLNSAPTEKPRVRVEPAAQKIDWQDFRDHLATARRELLMAVRATIDSALTRLEGSAPTRKPRRVKIK